MTETEVERLVVRLMGDSSHFKGVLDKAVNDAIAATRKIEQEAQSSRVQNDLLRRAAAAVEAVKTPTEKYADTMGNLNELYTKGAISQQTYTRSVEEADKVLRTASTALTEYGSNLRNAGLTIAAVGGVITGALAGVIGSGLMAAGKFEGTKIAFETMMGSVEEAQILLGKLTKYAAETPFEMPEIEVAAKGLMVFGERGDELMETLGFLGNAASATGTDFGMLALIYNQIRGTGKLLMQDFRQLTTRGVLTLQDVADHFGVTTAAAQKMQSDGKIAFEDVRNILKKMSEEGGRFANMTERQSKSMMGMWSTLKDNINIAKREFGEYFIPVVKLAMSTVMGLTESFVKMDPILKGALAVTAALALTIGVVVTVIGTLMAIVGQMIIGYVALTIATGGLNLASMALAVTMGALKTGGVMALAAAYVYLLKTVYNSSQSVKDYNESLKETIDLSAQLSKRHSEERAEILQTAAAMTDKGKRKAFLEEELKRAQSNAEGLKWMVQDTTKQVDAMAPSWMSAWQSGRKEWQGQQEQLNILKNDYSDATQNVRDLQKALGDIGEIREGSATDEQIENAKEYVASLKLQAETFGMTSREAKIAEAAIQGVAAATLNQMLAEDARLTKMEEAKKKAEESAKATKDLQKDIENYIETLEKQTNTLSKTVDQEKIAELQKRGATAAQLARMQALVDEKTALEATKKAAEAQKKVMEEGKRVSEQFLTPQEKYIKQLDDLERLYKAGAISRKTMDQGIAAAEKTLRDADLDATVRFKVEGNEAVREGTAEFRKLLAGIDQRNEVNARVAQANKVREDAKAVEEFAKSFEKNAIGQPAPVTAANPVPVKVEPGSPNATATAVAAAPGDQKNLLERIAAATEGLNKKDTLVVQPLGLN